jgi:hypothetical protein
LIKREQHGAESSPCIKNTKGYIAVSLGRKLDASLGGDQRAVKIPFVAADVCGVTFRKKVALAKGI